MRNTDAEFNISTLKKNYYFLVLWEQQVYIQKNVNAVKQGDVHVDFEVITCILEGGFVQIFYLNLAGITVVWVLSYKGLIFFNAWRLLWRCVDVIGHEMNLDW
jgi:hypothetical protein